MRIEAKMKRTKDKEKNNMAMCGGGKIIYLRTDLSFMSTHAHSFSLTHTDTHTQNCQESV